MARITVEDCLQNIPSRFALVIAASQRAKQLINGNGLTINTSKGNKEIVNSLREIAAGKVKLASKNRETCDGDYDTTLDTEKEGITKNA